MHRLSPPRIIDASIIAINFDASMHRLISIIDADPYSDGRIIDASIIKNIDQRCIDYLAPASMMHRLSGPRINDASII